MNVYPSQANTDYDGTSDTLNLETKDLNDLVSGLKSREENLIELFDRNFKYKETANKKELNKLQKIQLQYQIYEIERERKENEILLKYQNFKTEKQKQKK